MRGHSKSPPKYRKHKASGQAVVVIQGQSFYLSPYGTKASKLEYDRLIGEWLANGRQLPEPDQGSICVAQLAAQYLRHCKTYYIKNGKPTFEQTGIKIAIRQITAVHSRVSVDEFGPLALEAVRERMISKGNSRKYVNQQIGRLKRMFKWGVSKQLVPVQIYQALATVEGLRYGKSEARETGRVLPVSDSVVAETVKHLEKPVSDMVEIQRLTGCRPGEICSMKPAEVSREKPVWEYRPCSHKMDHKGRERVILIGPRAQAVLLPYLLNAPDSFCFVDKAGKPYDNQKYYRRIERATNRAFPAPMGTKGEELKAWRKSHRWTPNQLRHSAATEIRSKYGLEASQTVLGHSSADVTQIYAERDLAKAAKIMAEVG